MRNRAVQVNLEPRRADILYELARRDGVPVAQLLRDAVGQYLAGRAQSDDPFLEVIGLVREGDVTDVAHDLDEELARSHDVLTAESAARRQQKKRKKGT